MLAKKLIRALRKGNITLPEGCTKVNAITANGLHKTAADLIEVTERFQLDIPGGRPSEKGSPSAHAKSYAHLLEECLASAIDMEKIGLWHLPFPTIYVEFKANLLVQHVKKEVIPDLPYGATKDEDGTLVPADWPKDPTTPPAGLKHGPSTGFISKDGAEQVLGRELADAWTRAGNIDVRRLGRYAKGPIPLRQREHRKPEKIPADAPVVLTKDMNIAVIAGEKEDGEEGEITVRAFVNIPEMDGQMTWRDLTFAGEFRPSTFDSGFYIRSHVYSPEDPSGHTKRAAETLLQAAAEAVIINTVLLSTIGASREWVRTGPAKTKARNQPEDGFTIVRAYEPQGGTGAPLEGTRHRPRLHMRRGHLRTQRHGRGRKKTKVIWIQPCLVGHEEDGRIHHEYEVDEETGRH